MNGKKFKGFYPETVEFFKDLKLHNQRLWFKQHKTDFENFVLNPAKEFVMDMGEQLRQIRPNIVAEPRVDKSIFRIHRDTRFSASKAPYKTHLGIYFWEGPFKKVQNPGFYFQLDESEILIGAGIYIFPPQHLKAYRDRVISEPAGAELKKIISAILQKHPQYQVGEKSGKRIPRGYPKDHPNAEFLLYKGLTLVYREPVSAKVFSEEIVNFCFEAFLEMAQLQEWLVEMVLNMNNGSQII